MPKPEFLCPLKDEPCGLAQMAGEALTDQLLNELEAGLQRVEAVGHFANMGTNLSIRAVEHLQDTLNWMKTDPDAVTDAMEEALVATTNEILPAFVPCGMGVRRIDSSHYNPQEPSMDIQSVLTSLTRRILQGRSIKQ